MYFVGHVRWFCRLDWYRKGTHVGRHFPTVTVNSLKYGPNGLDGPWPLVRRSDCREVRLKESGRYGGGWRPGTLYKTDGLYEKEWERVSRYLHIKYVFLSIYKLYMMHYSNLYRLVDIIVVVLVVLVLLY